MSNAGRFDGKVALVTGASRGIGRAVAERLGTDGAVVAVHFGHDEAAAKEVVDTIERRGGRAFAVGTELGAPGAVEVLWSAFERRLGDVTDTPGLDILVNNAGIGFYSFIEDVSEADLDEVFAINVKAPFFVTKLGLERLRDGGRIINISSAATRIATPATVGYSMSKGALDVLTHTLAQGVGHRGITVNAVAPGIVPTDINDHIRDPTQRAELAAYSTFNRLGETGDIADIVAFLASDDARWVTAQVIDATGGFALGV